MKIQYKTVVTEDVEVAVDWTEDGCVVFDGDTPIAVTASELDAFILLGALMKRWDRLPWKYIRMDGKPHTKWDDLV